MPYWRLFYHIVWATRRRQPVITPELEPLVHGSLQSKAIELEATVYAVNGIADHVHMVVSVPPKLALATFVGLVKGVTSAQVNQSGQCEEPFYWQEEYGVFSFDEKRLPNYVVYVNHQKEHHHAGTTIPPLERAERGQRSMVKEMGETYEIEDDAWRREFEMGMDN